MSVPAAGLTAILILYPLFFLVGAFAGRGKAGKSTTGGLLLADRRLPLVVGVFTMTATWVGGGYINGTAEAVYDSNRGMVWAQAPWGYALSLILGGLLFAVPMRRRRFTTLVDLFECRYGKRVAAMLFIAALFSDIFWSAAILAALGTTLASVLEIDFTLAIVASTAVAVAYTMIGGLWSVSYTDTLQLACMMAGLCLAIPFALEHTDGLMSVVASYGLEFQEAASIVPPATAWFGGTSTGRWGWQWLDYALLLVLGGIPWQVYFQRVLACRDDRTAVSFSVLAGFGCLLMAVPAILIGMIGSNVDWSGVSGGAPEDAKYVLPYVLRYFTPPMIAALGLGAVAAAVMSSVDSSILSASSMFAWNVYRPLLRPAAGDVEIRRVTRAAIFVVGAAAACLALNVQSVYTLWFLCADLVYVVLFPQLVMGLFVRAANRSGAVVGTLVGLGLRFGGGETALGIPAFIPYPLVDAETGDSLFPFRTTAMLAGLCTTWIVSKATGSWDRPRRLKGQE